MYIFGKKESLAIEIIPIKGGFCSSSLWINNAQIGEFEYIDKIDLLKIGLARFREKSKSRINGELFIQSAKTCIDIIDTSLFGDQDDLQISIELGKKYGSFCLSPNLCECFDSFFIVVISNGLKQRIISKHIKNGSIVEITVDEGTIESIFLDAEKLLLELAKNFN